MVRARIQHSQCRPALVAIPGGDVAQGAGVRTALPRAGCWQEHVTHIARASGRVNGRLCSGASECDISGQDGQTLFSISPLTSSSQGESDGGGEGAGSRKTEKRAIVG
ncbi:hypothetical protein AAFF_G00247000 [Aldrovandia affinis]|uniref:Uncharacterized protein n=1 Tax=Aldrovandia affinis TaxID=143900 RepID=A0AAD7WTP5_9TELE|nr:hypothetical protein AAFF_G00247000 [Aldrovandia affinis]